MKGFLVLASTLSTVAWSSIEAQEPPPSELAPLGFLVGIWDAHTEGVGRTLASQWEWSWSLDGRALRLQTLQSFDGGPFLHDIEELTGWHPAHQTPVYFLVNRQGRFLIEGQYHLIRPDSIERTWTMWSEDGSQVQGRDVWIVGRPDHFQWRLFIRRGAEWREAVYSPFEMQKRPF